MKIGDALAVIQRFFLDFIGTVIPGFALLLGAWMLASQPHFLTHPLFPPANDFIWILLVVGSYVIGHGITGLGETVVHPVAARLAAWLRAVKFLAFLAPKAFVPEQDMMQQISKGATFQRFVARYQEEGSEADKEKDAERRVRDWRSVAISIADEEKETIYRFTFLSLLNLGVATVLWLLPLLWLGLHLLNLLGIDFLGSAVKADVLVALPAILLALLVSLLFLERRFRFYRITMSVPFSMALGKLTKEESQKDKPTGAAKASAVKTIYLAGRCKPAWRDVVKLRVTGVRYFDWCADRPKEAEAAALWTRRAIERCDFVFAYAENHGPGLYMLALEVGYARALGKKILLIEGKLPKRRAFALVSACADETFDSLEAGCAFLGTLLQPEAKP